MVEFRRTNAQVLQKRTLRSDAFGKAKRARFLDALATTCNIEMAARHADVNPSTAQSLRRRNGEFARLWAEAIELGQERLREELIARALGQVADDDNPGEARRVAPTAGFDPDLALRILQMQARADPGARRRPAPAAPTKEEVYAALAKRLDEAEARIARRDAAARPLVIEQVPEER